MELRILEGIRDIVQVIYDTSNSGAIQYRLKAFQYVGYVILPNHAIVINPKIDISFINMIKYALDLTDYSSESYSELDKEENHYDILVQIFLFELEQILQKGLLKDIKIMKKTPPL